MTGRKPVRTRGKLQFSRFFQNLKKGDFVSIIKEKSLKANFPKRLQGKTGIVEKKQGKVFVIKLKDINKFKQYLIEPIHLKKVKQNQVK